MEEETLSTKKAERDHWQTHFSQRWHQGPSFDGYYPRPYGLVEGRKGNVALYTLKCHQCPYPLNKS